jgi:hypothetical protein
MRFFIVLIIRMAFTGIVYPPREVLVAGFFLWLGGSVEIPGRNKQSLPGGSLHIVLLPPPPGHPPVAIIIRRLIKNPTKEGVRGCSPWTASPTGGERGSPSELLQSISEQRRKKEFNRSVCRALFSFKLEIVLISTTFYLNYVLLQGPTIFDT